MSETIIGIVDNGRFIKRYPKTTPFVMETRLTSIQVQTGMTPESRELDLSEYEGKVIAVSGIIQGGWVYEAEVTDTGGAITIALVSEVFVKATTGLPPLGEPETSEEPSPIGEGPGYLEPPELALVKNGQIFLWSDPNSTAMLYIDPMNVGYPQRPLIPPDDARCGIVSFMGAGSHATLSTITDLTTVLILEALFELKKSSAS